MAKTLLEVLEEQEIETFDSSNGRRVANCMFHEGDRSPSFTIYPTETYYCFGCEKWGDAVKFMVEYKGMTSKEAMEYVGVDYRLPKAEKRVIKVTNMSRTTQFLYNIAQQYHHYLMERPGPMKYLLDRGLTQHTIEKFMLGYTDGAVLNLQFAQDYEMGNEVGLINKNGYEALSHRITIPNIVDRNLCDFLIGRTVINDKIKYLGLRMPKPIGGFFDVRHSPILFLVEGQFDWLILRQWEYPAVVVGGSHLTRSSLQVLKDKYIVIVPDNDEVGIKSANKIKEQLPNSQILDYADLGVKDVSELATQPEGWGKFDSKVQEQLWELNSSRTDLSRWLPILQDMTPSLLT